MMRLENYIQLCSNMLRIIMFDDAEVWLCFAGVFRHSWPETTYTEIEAY